MTSPVALRADETSRFGHLALRLFPLLPWLIFYAPVWAGQIPCFAPGDLWLNILENQAAINSWLAGELPGWDASFAFGHPLHDGYASIYYPGLWLFHILGADPLAASARVAAVHALWGGIGMWFLLKELGEDETVRSIGAALMAVAPRFLALYETGLMAFVMFEAFYPWLLWGICRAGRRDFMSGVLIACVALGMQALILPSMGHVSAFLIVLMSFMETCLRRPRRPGRAVFMICAIGMGGALFGAAQILPTFIGAMQTPRADAVLAAVFDNVLFLQQLVLFIVPELWWPFPTQVMQGWLFPGHITLVAALAGILCLSRSNRLTRYLLAVMVLLALALGDRLPLYRILIYPWSSFLCGPLRFVGPITPLLIAYSASIVIRLPTIFSHRLVVRWIVSTLVCLLAIYFGVLALMQVQGAIEHTTDPWVFSHLAEMTLRAVRAMMRLMAVGVALCLCARLLSHRISRYALLPVILLDTILSAGLMYSVPFLPPTTGYPEEILPIVRPRATARFLPMHGGNEAVKGLVAAGLATALPRHMLVDSRYLETFQRGFHSSSSAKTFLADILLKPLPPPDTPVLASLGVQYFIVDHDKDYPGCHEIGRSPSGRYRVLENPGARPAWWLTDQWRVLDVDSVPERRHFLDTLEDRPFVQAAVGRDRPAEPMLLERSVAPLAMEAIKKGGTPNCQEYAVELTGPALLVIHEQYHPAWRCLINGREVPIVRVNGFLRGVFLAPGRNDIRFHFRNQWVYIGAAVSCAAVVLWLVGTWYLIRRSRAAPSTDENDPRIVVS